MLPRVLHIGALIGAAVLAGCATSGSGSPSIPSPTSSPSPSPMPSIPSPTSTPSLPSPPSSPSTSPSTAGAEGDSSQREDGSADTGVPAGSDDARTPEERRSGVDGKLDASLGTFDDQIRREQQRTAQERDARAAGRAEAGAVDEAERSGKQEGRDRSGDLRSEGNAGTGEKGEEGGDAQGDSQASQEPGSAMPRGGGGAAAGNAVPNGDDDDIIARRLRKAAESETDPELKEKLWKEYRDYKENTRGGS